MPLVPNCAILCRAVLNYAVLCVVQEVERLQALQATPSETTPAEEAEALRRQLAARDQQLAAALATQAKVCGARERGSEWCAYTMCLQGRCCAVSGHGNGF